MLVSARAMLITGARQTHCWNIGSATVSSTALRSVRLDADLLRSLFCVSRSGLVPLNASYSEPSPSGAQVAPRRGRANPAAAEQWTATANRQAVLPAPSAVLRPYKWQDADTSACRVEHRVGHRGSDWRNAGFANAGRRSGGFDDVNLDGRHFVDPQHVVAVEIALDNLALIERDLGFHDCTKSEADAAFHLRANLIGIHRRAAIDGADDAVDLGKSTAIDRNLGHLRDIRVKRLGNGDAAKTASRGRRTPSGLLGGKPQDSCVSRFIL